MQNPHAVRDNRSCHMVAQVMIARASRARATRSRHRARTSRTRAARARRAALVHTSLATGHTQQIVHARLALAGRSKTPATKLRASRNPRARSDKVSPLTVEPRTICNVARALSLTLTTTRAPRAASTPRQMTAPFALRSLCARKASTSPRSQPRHLIVYAARIWRSVPRAITRLLSPRRRMTASARYGARAVQENA